MAYGYIDCRLANEVWVGDILIKVSQLYVHKESWLIYKCK